MSLVFEKVSQALSAGEKLVIGIAGTFLRLSACQWPVQVTLIKENRIVGTMNNMLAGDYVEGVEFDAVWIINGATAQAVEVQISGGGAGSNRVLGEVSVIDGGKFRTMSGTAFAGTLGSGGLAGNYSHSQLFNPAGSGKNIVVEQVAALTTVTANGIAVVMNNAALTTPAGIFPQPKKSGGGATVAKFFTQQSAAALGGATLFMMVQGMIFKPAEPLVITPGYGLIARSTVVNQDVTASFEFYEEPI